MNLSQLREPIEVYQAAAGDPEPLAKRIESGAEMYEWERDTLAAFLRGELVPPKRGRGQRTLAHLAEGTEEEVKRRRIKNAAVLVDFIMQELRKKKEHYGRKQEVIDHVSKKKYLSWEEINRLHDMLKSGAWSEPNFQKDDGNGILHNYHRWLLKTGRLPEFPQLVGYEMSPEYILKVFLDEGLITQEEIDGGRPDLWIAKRES